MKNRRSEYDVTNTVNVTDAYTVFQAVCDIFKQAYGAFNKCALERAFSDFDDLFKGEYDTYQACDTLYHDIQHSLDMSLALARLIDGHDRTVTGENKIGPERAVIAIIAALFHDSGYLRHRHDYRHNNGAEYTVTHISRSSNFLKKYMVKAGLSEHALTAANMVHYTGYEMPYDQILLPDDLMHLAGHMLGTADLIAQMADRCYLEKCRDRLYTEFVLAGIAVQLDDNGNEKVMYESGEDLLRKTPVFYEMEVEKRLNGIFNGVYNYEKEHFDGKRYYIDAVGLNQAHLQRMIKSGNMNQLNRVPPSNHGVNTFPGLDAYLDDNPQQLLLPTGAVAKR